MTPRRLSKEESDKRKARRTAYDYFDKDHTTRLAVKLNNNTDADIISYLATKPNKQGFVKEVIRDRMTTDGFEYRKDDADE